MKQIPEKIAERNIRSIYEREQAERDQAPRSHKIANSIAAFSGTVLFCALNAIVFATWIGLNLLSPWKFDPYPFTFLTMLVSLESIFLSTFVLISQNTFSAQAENRHNLDLQINLLNEQESTALIRVVVQMAEKMKLDTPELEALRAAAMDIDPEKILEKIDEVEGSTRK